jgi:multisubunit Na+/H+ antiporter MnhB subunit
MNGGELAARNRLYRVLLALVTISIFLGLAFAVWSLPPDTPGLAEEVHAELAATGVRNSVTATLLQFRGYDTLLELAVLLLALIAIRAMRRGDLALPRPGGEILTVLVGLQAPAMILIAGYLLWSGADAPGGAFQAGAVLAAAGVLMILAGIRMPQRIDGLPFRVGLTAGLAMFIGLGIAGIIASGAFLDYSRLGVRVATLVLEGSATVSIGLVLLELFRSVLGGTRSHRKVSRTTDKRR